MRKSVAILTAAWVAMSLVACGGSGTSETTTSKEPAAATTKPAAEENKSAAGTLKIWVDETRADDFKKLGEEFTAETGVALDVVQKPSADIRADFVSQAPAGEGPDLLVGAHDWIGELVSNGVISPVELGGAEKTLSAVSKRGFTKDGQLYGVPYAVENIALVRNNGIVKETPKTFDELVEQGKKSGVDYPVLIQQSDKGDAYHLYPLQTSFGAPVFKSNNGEYTAELGMEGEAGEAFAKYLKKLADQKVLSAAMGPDQAKQAFLDGKSPYMITGPWSTGDFIKAGLDISVLPIPSAGGKTVAPFVGVQGVYLSSKSENALLANQYLTWMMKPEIQKKFYELGGRVPAVEEVAKSLDDKILAGFAEAGKDGDPMPALPEMSAVWNFWGAAEISIINGQASDPVEAWKTMNKNIKEAF
ncbi:MAG: maltose ABC transporter substrate-binding protein [Propionibacterium sp.]|nr:MAG: maltose ABC transporter substrate-binding protein [Propionibacterium sp.]